MGEIYVTSMPQGRWLYNSDVSRPYIIGDLDLTLDPGELIRFRDTDSALLPGTILGDVSAVDHLKREIVLASIRVVSISSTKRLAWLRAVVVDTRLKQ